MKFTESGLMIGKSDSAIKGYFVNDRLVFYMNDTPMAYFSDNKLYVAQAEILTRLQIGHFAFEPQANGNMSIIYAG